jgi:cytochrome c551/c552
MEPVVSGFSRTLAMLRALPVAAAVIVIAGQGQTAATGPQSGNSPPVVTITRPADMQVLPWGSAFRYAITVSDREDGDSASGEIPPHTILLEVEYRGSAKHDARSGRAGQQAGLDVLRTSTCFTCHADKISLVGPSFAAIAERYGRDPETLGRLGGRIRHGSSGQWGSLAMPPHGDLSDDEALAAARFIVEQGSQRRRWVYAGAEGVIRIVDKPADGDAGTYTLTASYLDNGIGGVPDTRTRGEDSRTFVIK